MSEEKQTSLFDGDGDGEAEEQELEEQQLDDEHEQDGADDGEDDECGCDDENQGDGGKKPRAKKANAKTANQPTTEPVKPAAQTTAKATAPAAPAYTYPFVVRYAGTFLDLLGFNEGQAYTVAQIKELLVQNGYTEFREMEIDLHPTEDKTVLAITIRGSRKGVRHG
ncbi:MAG TPA: hypothetical protein VD969_19715 [Symbiobacteriaceae bacterium]|nr:hypothetical protein [Symbiobacteriaceae bacterium]